MSPITLLLLRSKQNSHRITQQQLLLQAGSIFWSQKFLRSLQWRHRCLWSRCLYWQQDRNVLLRKVTTPICVATTNNCSILGCPITNQLHGLYYSTVLKLEPNFQTKKPASNSPIPFWALWDQCPKMPSNGRKPLMAPTLWGSWRFWSRRTGWWLSPYTEEISRQIVIRWAMQQSQAMNTTIFRPMLLFYSLAPFFFTYSHSHNLIKLFLLNNWYNKNFVKIFCLKIKQIECIVSFLLFLSR